METSTQGTAKRIRVMVATEEPALALGAAWLLASAGEFELTKSPATYTEVVPMVAQEAPDLLLLDMAPEVTPALFTVVRQAAPACRIVLWARSLSDELTFHAAQNGIAGIVRRNLSNEQFLNQLRAVTRGAAGFERPARDRSTTIALTPRESQIVGLLAQGLKNKEIASCLGLSEGTVKSYLVQLFRKVGARDRFELAVLGLKNTYCGEAFWDGQHSFVSQPEADRARPVLRSLVLIEPARRRGYPEQTQKAAGGDR